MPHTQSAGLIVYRWAKANMLEVLLVHPGGPFWAHKDNGAWSIPKGEYDTNEDPWAAAQREFVEETGCAVPLGTPFDIGSVVYGSKTVRAWAIEGHIDTEQVRSNTFTMVWPPRSGKIQQFSEVDRAGWFALEEASHKLVAGQQPFVDRIREQLDVSA